MVIAVSVTLAGIEISLGNAAALHPRFHRLCSIFSGRFPFRFWKELAAKSATRRFG
jgi:hypothetical protein